jgi:ABC-type uncharacterized transport system permease subunit
MWVSQTPRRYWGVHFSVLYTYIFNKRYVCIGGWTSGHIHVLLQSCFLLRPVFFLFFHGHLRRNMPHFNTRAVLDWPTYS